MILSLNQDLCVFIYDCGYSPQRLSTPRVPSGLRLEPLTLPVVVKWWVKDLHVNHMRLGLWSRSMDFYAPLQIGDSRLKDFIISPTF